MATPISNGAIGQTMAKRSSLPLDCIDGCVPYTILNISDKEDILVEERRVPFPVDEYIEILLQSD